MKVIYVRIHGKRLKWIIALYEKYWYLSKYTRRFYYYVLLRKKLESTVLVTYKAF